MVLAIKYNDDNYYNNKYYARIGGITLEELNFLEREMISIIGYRLCVPPKTYKFYLREIIKNATRTFTMDMEDIKPQEKEKEDMEIQSIERMDTVPSIG